MTTRTEHTRRTDHPRPTDHTRPSGSIAGLVDRTPDTRDRRIDGARALSTVFVAIGHWLVAVPMLVNGELDGKNLLTLRPSLGWLTWIFQVVPLFFAVGGFSNTASWDRARREGTTYGTWLGQRLLRLLQPVLVFAITWSTIGAATVLFGAGTDSLGAAAGLVTIPVWFLSVYAAVIAATPAIVWIGRRCGGLSVALVFGVAGTFDLLRFHVAHQFGVLNVAFVWAGCAVIGVIWRDGHLPSGRDALRMSFVTMALMAAIVRFTGYQMALVHAPGQTNSNTHSPTMLLLAIGIVHIGLVRGLPLDRLLGKRSVWSAVVAINGHAMSILLWHFTALAIAAAAFIQTGISPTLDPASGAWWIARLPWMVLLSIVILPLLAVFGRVERRSLVSTGPIVNVSTIRALAAAGLAVAGFYRLTVRDVQEPSQVLGVPWLTLALLVGALALVSRDRLSRSHRQG